MIGVTALAVALGGSAAAASAALQKGDKLIAKHSLSGNRLHNNTVTGAQVKESTLGAVPKAKALTPLVWHDFTLLNAWQNYGASYSGTPQYAKDGAGFVHLRGAIAHASATSVLFASLPDGFRPAEAHDWLNVASTNDDSTPVPVALDVESSGDILVEAGVGASLAFVSLAGVEFYAG
ncbi:MAG TPA: hypothetical protein VHV76_09215 [Mycobacteriales bacterium]|jgi:hypothetical protein|nr:hypothetical protein [Mycobacteriales bacterium]